MVERSKGPSGSPRCLADLGSNPRHRSFFCPNGLGTTEKAEAAVRGKSRGTVPNGAPGGRPPGRLVPGVLRQDSMGAMVPSGARGLLAPPGAGRELAWAPVVGTSEDSTAEDCTPGDRTCEGCTAQVCPPEDCTSEDNTSEDRSAEDCTADDCSSEDCISKDRASEDCTSEDCASEDCSTEGCTSGDCTSGDCSAEGRRVSAASSVTHRVGNRRRPPFCHIVYILRRGSL